VGGGGANRGATLTDTRAALAVELVNFCGGSGPPFWLSGGRRMENEQWIGDDGGSMAAQLFFFFRQIIFSLP
jgi:hypothetical protein